MPRTPQPDEDDPATITPLPPVYYAEQALLGALLSDPQHLADVTGIAPEAFSTAAHAAVFAAIRAVPAPALAETTDYAAAFAALRAQSPSGLAERTEHIAWLGKVLTTARQQARGLTAAHLHALISACPNPRHTPAYARIIAVESARRRLRKAAARLVHTARDASLPHPVPAALAEADTLASVVDEIAATFPPHSGPLPRTPAPPPTPLHDSDEAAQEERLLLATCTARPAEVEQMRWLIPEDFTHPLHAGLWQCLTALLRRDVPVDPVTVIWEAQQRGVLSAADDPRDLLTFLAEPDVSAPYLGERILHRAALISAHHVGRRIMAFTDDPANTPCQLVVGSRRALAELTAIRARWHHAATLTPTTWSPRRTARRAPRAGPPPATAPPTSRIAR
ncbi:DnaB-like helicase N-terminal domain-containing protein [Streptomyces sp. ID05-39B]|uniref:DnaB-like helicase N-terminal domain-containing protein n=1 Tax=Streptomyces sp. ID05-39B TaxID=3028664 RepID=UPI0029B4598B|nr:DnaB-like helicase N-terminal domain-containing protein [Streptomyces sp. ID05-39B]MDX3525889.1 DnaB-like helicase N-terminal domain-containing protein [Streptomyces sp. ID05-39B]